MKIAGIFDLISQLPCSANERGDDQRDGQGNEKPDIAVAVCAEVIQRVNFIQHEVPHCNV